MHATQQNSKIDNRTILLVQHVMSMLSVSMSVCYRDVPGAFSGSVLSELMWTCSLAFFILNSSYSGCVRILRVRSNTSS